MRLKSSKLFRPRFPCSIQFFLLILSAILTMMGAFTVDAAPPTIGLACPVPPIDGHWTALRITLPSGMSSPITVSLRDARGGPELIRTFNSSRRSVLFSLPFLQSNRLSSRIWPIEISLDNYPDKKRWQTFSVVRSEATGAMIAIATLPNTRRLLSKIGTLFQPAVLVPMRISDQELANTPVLALASCRYVLLDKHAARKLSFARELALISVGIKLVFHGSVPPRHLHALLWRQMAGHPNFWQLPGSKTSVFNPPPIVVRRLGRMSLPTVRAPATWKYAIWGFIPIGLMLIALVRLATHRALIGLGILAMALALFSLGTLWWLNQSSKPLLATCQWVTQSVSDILAIQNHFILAAPLRGGNVQISNHAALPPLPIVADASQWLKLHGKIYLSGHVNRLTLFVPVDRIQPVGWSYTLTASPLPPSPSPPNLLQWQHQMRNRGWRLSRSVFIVNGQVFPINHPLQETSFNFWVDQQTRAIRNSLRAWFALNFLASRSYCVELPGAEEKGNLHIIDLSRLQYMRP